MYDVSDDYPDGNVYKNYLSKLAYKTSNEEEPCILSLTTTDGWYLFKTSAVEFSDYNPYYMPTTTAHNRLMYSYITIIPQEGSTGYNELINKPLPPRLDFVIASGFGATWQHLCFLPKNTTVVLGASRGNNLYYGYRLIYQLNIDM